MPPGPGGPRRDRRAVPADARPDRPGRPDGPLSDRARPRRPTCSSAGPTSGEAVRLGDPDDPDDDRWADRENLAEIRRATVAVRRRESLAVAPEVFADFLLAPAARPSGDARRGPGVRRDGAGTAPGLRDAGAALGGGDPAAPGRAATGRPGWTTSWRAARWLWRAEGSARGEPRVAFFPRDFAGSGRRTADEPGELGPDEARILDCWVARARASRPSWRGPRASSRRGYGAPCSSWPGAGLATNDRFDPLRPAPTRRSRRWPRPRRTAPAADRCGSGPRRLGRRPGRGPLVAPEILLRATPRPGSGLGRALARSLWRAEPRGRRAGPVGARAGASWPRCSRAPSGAARSAAATSSRASPASSTPPRRPPPSWPGSRPGRDPASPVVLRLDARPGQPLRRRRPAGRRAPRRRHRPACRGSPAISWRSATGGPC